MRLFKLQVTSKSTTSLQGRMSYFFVQHFHFYARRCDFFNKRLPLIDIKISF